MNYRINYFNNIESKGNFKNNKIDLIKRNFVYLYRKIH